MRKKPVSGIVLMLLLTSMLSSAFIIQPTKAADGTIYIRANGSVDPPSAPILNVGNGYYKFTADIYDSIVVERDNIEVDGAGYTVRGTGGGTGISLSERSHVTIKNMKIEVFEYGIYLHNSSYNTIFENNITNNYYDILLDASSNNNSISGNNITNSHKFTIWLDQSSHNSVSGNNITNNGHCIVLAYNSSYNSIFRNNITNNGPAIYLIHNSSYNSIFENNIANNHFGTTISGGSNNKFYHNNFIDNTEQVHSYDSTNAWDDGYPSGGNYWSDYTDVDLYSGLYQNETGSDGIWDTPYLIDANNQDRYPLVNPWTPTPTLIPGKDVPAEAPDFFPSVLTRLNIASSEFAVQALTIWTNYENTNAYWNPLATTWDMGEKSWDFNEAGVKNYADKETGIQATANTLALHYYESIRELLAKHCFDEQHLREAVATWSGLYPSDPYVINLVTEWRDIYPACAQLQLVQVHIDEVIVNDLNENGRIFCDELNVTVLPDLRTVNVTMLAIANNLLNLSIWVRNTGDSDIIFEIPSIVLTVTPSEYEGYITHNEYFYLLPSPGFPWEVPPGVEIPFEPPILLGPSECVQVKEHLEVGHDLLETVTVDLSIHFLAHAVPEDTPPTCVVHLRKDGIEIDEIDVWEFFDICVGNSTDDTGIKQVRFSSDNDQDNHPTGEWTQWYNWENSIGDWNAPAKIKRWSFTTPGYKEVWAEVKDDINQSDKRLACIYVPGTQPPTCGIELQKEGVEIDGADVGHFFDIYVGGSTDDAAIEQVTFSSDDSQDGTPTGEWTEWFDWDGSLGDWDGVSKIKKWSFDTAGKKEVWAMIEDSDGNVVRNHATIFVHPGYAIIVAGQGRLWKLDKQPIDHCANNAYKVLRNLGFDDLHISYLNSNHPQDVDDDGDDEVDAPALLSHFENAMGEIKDKIGNNPTPLVIYLVGHGERDFFEFDKNAGVEGFLFVSKGVGVIPGFQDMLAEFSNEVPMLIVINSCYSGCFITSNDDSPGSISSANRIIITTTHDDQKRYAFVWVRSSDRFWGSLNKGSNVKEAFTHRATPGDNSHMWLDDNGDRIGHPPNNLENDGELATETKIGVLGTEDLKLTPWQLIWKRSPGELRVYDSQNRVTGLVNGEVKEEIPNSVYDKENAIVAIFAPSEIYRYEIVGTDEGTYELEIATIEGDEATAFTAADIPTSPNATHQYTIDWDALSLGEEGVTVQVDSKGDGVFEHTFASDEELKHSEYVVAINAISTWITDSDFSEIESFQAVFTPGGNAELFKLTATNPGQFYFSILVNNTWPEPLNLTITYSIDPNFTTQGARAIHVYADLNRTIDITANCTFSDNTITMYNLAPNATAYVTIHLDYAMKGTMWTTEEVEAWYSEHAFNATASSITSKIVITDP